MRARNIKPSTFANEILGSSNPFLTILFAGLWCLADREGRLEDRPLKIKGQVFPYRNFTEAKMNILLDALAQAGFIRRYHVTGKRVIQVVSFLEHQSPHSNEKESELEPEPEQNQQDTGSREKEASPCDLAANSSESGIRESENQDSGTLSSLQSPADEVFAYWQQIHEKPRAQFTLERKRKVKERLADSTMLEIKQAIDGCRASPHHQGHNERGTMYDDLELICRSRTQLEKMIGYGHKVQNNGTNRNNSNNNAKATGGEIIANRPYR